MLNLLKDVVSFFIYALICPFFRNKKAVLVYHSISSAISPYNDPYKINVGPDRFRAHMAYIARKKDKFTVTFDDSYENIYFNAFPIVQKHNVKSIVFVLTDYVDKKISMGCFFNKKYSPKPLTWNEVNEMKDAGVEIGCHSKTHKNLAELKSEELNGEAFTATKRIMDATGQRPRSFAYPFGNADSFNEKTEKVLKENGYKKIYTNIMGMDNSEEEPFKVRRIRIYSTDNIFRFKMKIAGAYNWVDMLQKESI